VKVNCPGKVFLAATTCYYIANGVNAVSKKSVTCAVVIKLLRQAERFSRQGYKMCIQNCVEKPIHNDHLKVRECNNKMK
jgi:hypothetical protein